MDLSIVVPAFNEATNLRTLATRVRDSLAPLQLDWELIVVDDGSTDGTYAEISRLHQEDPHVQGLRLSRNFGHQLALLAGLKASSGAAVVMMDADLQHPPELIPKLIALWKQGHSIVQTVREEQQGASSFKRLSSWLFYQVFRAFSGLDLRPGMADFRLVERRVLDAILLAHEQRPFFRGLVVWSGFVQATVSYRSPPRQGGVTGYSLPKMLRLALAGVVGFSIAPLYVALMLGLVGLLFSLVYGVYAVAVFLSGIALPGWTSIAVLVSFLMSLQFMILGILGMYVGEIAVAVRGRPNVLVDVATFNSQPREPPVASQATPAPRA